MYLLEWKNYFKKVKEERKKKKLYKKRKCTKVKYFLSDMPITEGCENNRCLDLSTFSGTKK